MPRLAFVDSAKGPEGITDHQDKWKQESIWVSGEDKQLKQLAIANSVNRPFVGLSWVMRREKRLLVVNYRTVIASALGWILKKQADKSST